RLRLVDLQQDEDLCEEDLTMTPKGQVGGPRPKQLRWKSSRLDAGLRRLDRSPFYAISTDSGHPRSWRRAGTFWLGCARCSQSSELVRDEHRGTIDWLPEAFFPFNWTLSL